MKAQDRPAVSPEPKGQGASPPVSGTKDKLRLLLYAVAAPLLHLLMQVIVAGVAALAASFKAIGELGRDRPSQELAERATEIVRRWNDGISVISNAATLLLLFLFFFLLTRLAPKKSEPRMPGEPNARGRWAVTSFSLRPIPRFCYPLAIFTGIALYHGVSAFLWLVSVVAPGLSEEYINASSAVTAQGSVFVNFLALVVFAPLTEELVYRVFPVSQLGKIWPAPVAILLPALLFGAVHGNFVWFLYASCCGILFGALYYRYRSLFPSLVVHASFNLVGFLYTRVDTADGTWWIVISCLCLPILGVLLFFLLRKPRKTADSAGQDR